MELSTDTTADLLAPRASRITIIGGSGFAFPLERAEGVVLPFVFPAKQ
jgi:hypothetical protein